MNYTTYGGSLSVGNTTTVANLYGTSSGTTSSWTYYTPPLPPPEYEYPYFYSEEAGRKREQEFKLACDEVWNGL